MRNPWHGDTPTSHRRSVGSAAIGRTALRPSCRTWRCVSVLLAKRALPRPVADPPPPDIAAALARLPDAFGQLGLAAGDANLNIKALRGQPGLYRLRVGDWRA